MQNLLTRIAQIMQLLRQGLKIMSIDVKQNIYDIP